jgi:hypothetical protein
MITDDALNCQQHRIIAPIRTEVKHTFYQVHMHALELELKTQIAIKHNARLSCTADSTTF